MSKVESLIFIPAFLFVDLLLVCPHVVRKIVKRSVDSKGICTSERVLSRFV